MCCKLILSYTHQFFIKPLIVTFVSCTKNDGPANRIEPRQPGGCKLKTAPVRPVVAARPAEYVCSEDLFY
ncbi:hypothetical protein BTT40_21750 [Salmonella enterica subsp. enterica serovar Infantis]|nr:hypothetical protein [Salmonella enterica subsp. enterica serovar Infantis]